MHEPSQISLPLPVLFSFYLVHISVAFIDLVHKGVSVELVRTRAGIANESTKSLQCKFFP